MSHASIFGKGLIRTAEEKISMSLSTLTVKPPFYINDRTTSQSSVFMSPIQKRTDYLPWFSHSEANHTLRVSQKSVLRKQR
jgi:hypothetical protein